MATIVPESRSSSSDGRPASQTLDRGLRILEHVTESNGPLTVADVATGVAIVATFAQIGWLLARGRKVDTMLWASLALIVVFGGATLFFHDATFIKWKPTILYWLFSTSLLVSAVVFNKNLIRSFMEAQLKLPDDVWSRLNVAWIGFFACMGFLNLYVAFQYTEATWVKFKLFGGMGLMFLFVIAQSMFLGKYIEEDKQ